MPARPLRAGAELEVRATGIDPSGAGIGEVHGVAVHIRDLLPGECARIAIEHVSQHRPHTAWARVLQRVGQPAPERARPACPRFGECGGCVWQHLAYTAQLEHKRARVRRALRDHGLGHLEVAPVIPAPETLEYRNLGKYVVAENPNAGSDSVPGLWLGSYAPRSHRVIDTAGCRIVEPVIDQVRELARQVWRHVPVYDERTRAGWLRYVTVRAGFDQRALVAVVTSPDAERNALVPGAQALVADPRVGGVVWVRNGSRSGTIIDGQSERLCGRPTARERVADVDIDVGVGDFFQVNRAQLKPLYAEVARLAGWSIDGHNGDQTELLKTAIDAYCGVGGIAFTLARMAEQRGRACRIHGVERNPRTIANATRAAERAGLDDWLSFHAGEAAEMGLEHPDLIVVNPPRKGLSTATRASLHKLAPDRVVYVSCGPDSLARDLAALAPDYRVFAVQPIDLMPGTPQIETVVGLARQQSNIPGR